MIIIDEYQNCKHVEIEVNVEIEFNGYLSFYCATSIELARFLDTA